jgi:Rod binding domain-containing protein
VTRAADLSALGPGAIPPDVRRAGREAEGRYAAALSFERALVGELAKGLTTGAFGEGGSAATAAYRDMVPGTLADALAAGGGVGLARTIYDALGGAR